LKKKSPYLNLNGIIPLRDTFRPPKLKSVKILLLIVVLIAAIFLIVSVAGNRLVAAEGVHDHLSDHFDGKTFHNIGSQNQTNTQHRRHSFFGALKWMVSRPKGDWTWHNNRFDAKPAERVYGSKLVATFVNHATILIQTEGLNILTDPVWSERVGPASFIGPRRFRPPGIRFADLPPIDLVLISHNHYDHMDLPTLKRLRRSWKPRILVGLGNAEYLKEHGVNGATDMDWWDSTKVSDSVSVFCVPSQHFSGRGLSDRNKTLWCGYVIETPHGRIYFAGDTGYGPFFDEIHAHFPDFRLALLPIGAYLPRWFMKPVHMSPDEALQAKQVLGAQTAIGIHFGTFHMADDSMNAGPERIHVLLDSLPAPKPDFRILENGQSDVIPQYLSVVGY
jgi:L-ascorbate metabolism protein UlaG (beta-lactamase superfamily)